MNPRLLVLVRKEFLRIWRDPVALSFTISFPLVLLLLFGYAISTDVRRIPLLIYDQDRTAESRSFTREFSHSDYFHLVGHAESYRDVGRALDSGRAKAAVIVGPGFYRKMMQRKPAPAQIIVDGSDPNTADVALNYASQIARDYAIRKTVAVVEERIPLDSQRLRSIEIRPRILYNEALRSTNFFVPGLLGVIMMMLTAVSTASSIVRERERGTMEMLLVTPLRPYEILLGKLIPFAFLTFTGVVLIVIAGTWVFKVPMKGSTMGLLGYSVLFLIAGLSIGLFVSTTAKTELGASIIAVLVSLLPTIYLSGFIFPVESMIPPLRWISSLTPATYFLKITRGVYLKGVDFSILWPQALCLAVFTAAMLTANVLRFRKYL